MKNFFKIHPITNLILLSVLLSGYFNYFLVIFFILFFHDLGHILSFKFFKYKINNVLILPFGSILNTDLNQCSKSFEIFVISISGVLMQLLLYLLMFLLNKTFINDLTYNIFLKYNKIIILFNLLPIIPLDGSKIIFSILEYFLSYKKTMKIINFISIITIILFTLFVSFYSINSFLIIIFLIYKTIYEIKYHNHLFNHFLVTRALSKKQYKKTAYIYNIKHIYKNRFNFINNINEKKVLNSLYRL